MILTTPEAADLLGVSESRVRHMAGDGKLRALVPGSKPLTFLEDEVVEYELQHRRRRKHVASLAQQWRGMLDSEAETHDTRTG